MDLPAFDDPDFVAAMRLHEGLARQGPGSPETTRLLADLARPLPERPRVLDLGCGPGPAAVQLARELDAEVTAVDIYAPFLDELHANARRAGVADKVHTERRSMDDLPYPDASFDLVWSEGAAYSIGFGNALRLWRRLVAPGGALVVTECGWTTTTPSAGAREFWDALYPLNSTADNQAEAMAAGYTVTACYLLPDSDWFTEYYTPMERRAGTVDRTDPHTARAVDFQLREIAVRREHRDEYGYMGYVLRP